MPYTDDPQNVPSDRVRFLIGDTSTTNPELSDAEVDFLLEDENNDARRAAARAAEVLAAKFASKADYKEVGPLRLEYRQRSKSLSSLAKSLWAKATAMSAVPYAGGISASDKSSKEADPDRTPSDFYRDMMDYNESTLSEDDVR